MLLLLFHIDNDRYAIETQRIVEVLPLVTLRTLYHAPKYVAGMFNYRGTVVPVIDLRQLIQGQPSQSCLSTRIVTIDYAVQNPELPYVGLMVERVIDTLQQSNLMPASQGFQLKEAAYLGELMADEQGLLQKVSVEAFLSKPQQELLIYPLKNQENQVKSVSRNDLQKSR